MPVASPAGAGFVVDDRAFFEGIPHTFIDFENRGDGTPLDLGFGEAEFMPVDEYGVQGVLIGPTAAWRKYPPPVAGTPFDDDEPGEIGDAHAAVGSQPIAINGSDLTMHFTTLVHSVGIAVVQEGFQSAFPSLEGSTAMRIFDTAGVEIATVALWGDLIDGGFDGELLDEDGNAFNRIRYGFLGYASDTPIGRIEFTNTTFSIFDDLHFSAVPVPAPGAGVAFGLLGLGALSRRRR